MKVYVVQKWVAWEGFDILKVFLTLDSAQSFCSKEANPDIYARDSDTRWNGKDGHDGFSIEEYEAEP